MRFAADENLHNAIVRGVLRQRAGADFVRIQDVGLTATDDRTILAWAAAEGRILITHDAATATGYAYERVAGGEPMPGVFVVNAIEPLGAVIEDLVLILDCATPGEFEGQVVFLPFA